MLKAGLAEHGIFAVALTLRVQVRIFITCTNTGEGCQMEQCTMYLWRCIPPGLHRQVTKVRLGCHK